MPRPPVMPAEEKTRIVLSILAGEVTGCVLTAASGPSSPDGANGLRLLACDPTVAGPVEVLADSAYGTGAALAALTDAGHLVTIKPWPLRQPIPGGFTTADFTVDETTRLVTCPAGQTVTFSAARRVAGWGVRCADCPLRARCTTSPGGRKVLVHPHDRLQRAHRERMADPAVAADYRRHRPMVERSIAWLTRSNRRLRYRGVAKNNAWLHLRVGAINLRRQLALGVLQDPGRSGTWA